MAEAMKELLLSKRPQEQKETNAIVSLVEAIVP
jgi:hypothetical protein